MFGFSSTKGFRNHIKTARGILDANWTGKYTKPSPSLYPHQWNWDSGFIAIGCAHYNPQRAMAELLSLFAHQWDNGMVPQIVFNPDALGNYFPEPDFWQVPQGRLTSGITMPPLHAIACLHIYRHARAKGVAKDFLGEMFTKLMASHRYFYRYRDPEHTGLVYIRHPWESGLDNSPSWDSPLKAIEVDRRKLPPYERKDLKHGVDASQRPSDDDYDRYVYLVDLFRRLEYDEERIYSECPFLIQDVLFNSILCRANQDLVEIGRILGRDVAEAEQWLELTTHGISTRLWSEERKQFDPYCLLSKRMLPASTAAIFMPMYASAATSEQAAHLYERMNSASFCELHQGNCFTIPNFDMSREEFDSQNYWRGPVWININWMLSQGLTNYGYRVKADSMKKDIIQLPIRFGFHEYFDSKTGQGYGSDAFSWSAALFLDLVYDYYDQDRHVPNWLGFGKTKALKRPKVLNATSSSPSQAPPDLAARLMECMSELRTAFYDVKRGLVDYRAMKNSPQYREYLEQTQALQTFDLNDLDSCEQRLAFWINLYNTMVVHGVVELGLESSVREVSDFFSRLKYDIGGHLFSPDDMEHGILRANARPPNRLFRVFGRGDPRRRFSLSTQDARIHFALVCGSRSCAPIRYYQAEKIHHQLESSTRNFINSSEVVVLPERNKIMLSQIFKWYQRDFGGKREVLRFVLDYLIADDMADFLAQSIDQVELEYHFYDWNLNH